MPRPKTGNLSGTTPLSDGNTHKEHPVLSVSELNQFARGVLEMHVGKVWVSGEISNFSKPASGHWYFTLKDSEAQIRCAMFRNKNQFIRSKIDNGMQVLINGAVSLYPNRGDYQLIADYIEESGVGSLQRQFELLKNKLAAEGLFDPQHKQVLPKQLQHIAVITSATGAAIHDILSVLKERFPLLKVTLIPAAVQGEAAAGELIHALHLAEHWNNEEDDVFDAIIFGRGGGSLEDLWPFNEEAVVRAVFQCPIPIISAVGHEVDTTICDYVADVRAPTPSAAAEMISPDQDNLQQTLDYYEQSLRKNLQHRFEQCQYRLAVLQRALTHPGEKLRHYHLRFEQLQQQLHSAQRHQLQQSKQQVHILKQAIQQQSPQKLLLAKQTELQRLQQQLHRTINDCLSDNKNRLAQQGRLLEAVSPLSTLHRGYAIVQNNEQGVISNTGDAQIGQTTHTRLSDGVLVSEIKDIIQHNDKA